MAILKQPFERGEKLKATQGQWVVASLETHMPWPTKPQTVEYGGKEFLILPAERAEPGDKANPLGVDKSPAICLRADAHALAPAQARSEIMRFASALVWNAPAKLEIVSWTGGNLPRQMGFAKNRVIQDHLDTERLPLPARSSARTALALFRESTSLDNPFYAFLSLYKAFGVAVPPKERAAFIRANRDRGGKRGKERIAAIEREGHAIDQYLYEQGRHAIAHADRDPSVDPDSTDDHYRIQQDLPVMEGFARLAIEMNLGVKTAQTIYLEHLYELEGFRDLLSPGALHTVRCGAGAPLGENIQWPNKWLILAVQGVKQYPLPEMAPTMAFWCGSLLSMTYESINRGIRLSVLLDFQGERLIFDPIAHLLVNGSRSNRRLIDDELAALRFQLGILGNGHIEIWDADRECRLGRSETCLPVNCMVNFDFFEKEFAILEGLLNAPEEPRCDADLRKNPSSTL